MLYGAALAWGCPCITHSIVTEKVTHLLILSRADTK
jgi:hypothetical protein